MIRARPRSAPARAALDLYATAPLSVRFHVELRWRSCPLEAVAECVPRGASVLDLGCGHALFASYLALDAPTRRVHGVDLDEAKLARAADAIRRARELGANVTCASAPNGTVPDGPWGAITIVDVLYLLGVKAQRALLVEAAGRLAPGGVLLVKEMSEVPRWKAAWNRTQETIAVRWLRITASETDAFSFVPRATVRAWLEDAGLHVDERALDRGYVHPHHLFRAVRPA